MAARRMKGVVRPQAMPTRRKPRVQRNIEGEGLSSAVDIVMVGRREFGRMRRVWGGGGRAFGAVGKAVDV